MQKNEIQNPRNGSVCGEEVVSDDGQRSPQMPNAAWVRLKCPTHGYEQRGRKGMLVKNRLGQRDSRFSEES